MPAVLAPIREGWWRCEAKRVVGWGRRRVLLGRRRRDVGVDAGRDAKRRARRARVRGIMIVVIV